MPVTSRASEVMTLTAIIARWLLLTGGLVTLARVPVHAVPPGAGRRPGGGAWPPRRPVAAQAVGSRPSMRSPPPPRGRRQGRWSCRGSAKVVVRRAEGLGEEGPASGDLGTYRPGLAPA